MRLSPDFHETFLLNLLEARRAGLLATRRLVAMEMLQHVSPARLRGLFTPAVAQVILDVTRLGGLELEAAEGLWEDAQVTRLVEIRRTLSAMAAAAGSADSTSCLLPDGRRWLPMHLMRAESPWHRPGGLSVLIDHARHRVDGLGEDLRELVAVHGGGPGNLYVARTRFGLDARTLRDAWRFGATTAVRVARRASGSSLPRWGAIGLDGPSVDLSTLPPDVGVLVVDRRAGLPDGLGDDWAVFLGGANRAALRAYRDGRPVCFLVDSPAMAADCVLAFGELECGAGAGLPTRDTAEPIRFPAGPRHVAQG